MPDTGHWLIDWLILKSFEGTIWKQGAEKCRKEEGAEVEEVHEQKSY